MDHFDAPMSGTVSKICRHFKTDTLTPQSLDVGTSFRCLIKIILLDSLSVNFHSFVQANSFLFR